MIVKVAPMGETVTEINAPEGSTIEQCLEIAGVDHEDRAISLNSGNASLSTQVTSENSVISLANKMKGGR